MQSAISINQLPPPGYADTHADMQYEVIAWILLYNGHRPLTISSR